MKKVNFNLIPVQIEQGIITTKEAVDIISEFVCLNYPIFGLHKYDEDFRSEIVLNILEKGISMLERYDSRRGDFFTYFYYQIQSYIHTRYKICARKNIESSVKFLETINIEEEKEYEYNTIPYKTIEAKNYTGISKVPYAKQETTIEDLKKIFENIHGDKRLLVVAIKSAYYITDSQMKKICYHYNIDENDFFRTIEYFRNRLTEKAEKKLKLQERRNTAYFYHKNLETRIYNIESEKTAGNNFIRKDFELKDARYCKNWEKLNRRLEKGILFIRPTNKTVGSILGICERQVAYYITSIKNEHIYEKDASGYDNLN